MHVGEAATIGSGSLRSGGNVVPGDEPAGLAARHEAELVEAAETARCEPRHLAITIEAYAVEQDGAPGAVVALFAFPAISLLACLAGKIFSLPAGIGIELVSD